MGTLDTVQLWLSCLVDKALDTRLRLCACLLRLLAGI